MTVAYAPPLTGAPAEPGQALTHEAIRTGPAYARSRVMTRWHRIKSAYRRIEHSGEIAEVFHLWCGQTTFSARDPWLTDEPPAGEPRCGTCEGRAIGADPSRPEWLFTPWSLELPLKCPGSRTHFGDMLPGNATVTCLACRLIQPARATGSWHSSDWCIAEHAPGPNLPPGCEFHAWRSLTVVNGVTMCRCQVRSL